MRKAPARSAALRRRDPLHQAARSACGYLIRSAMVTISKPCSWQTSSAPARAPSCRRNYDFADTPRGLETGDTRQIDRRLGGPARTMTPPSRARSGKTSQVAPDPAAWYQVYPPSRCARGQRPRCPCWFPAAHQSRHERRGRGRAARVVASSGISSAFKRDLASRRGRSSRGPYLAMN